MIVSEEDIDLFHASLERASSNPVFLDTFYDSFMSNSSDIPKYFEHTDMDRLKRKLKSSLHMMTLLIDESPGIEMYVAHLSRVHDSYQIPAGMYQVWLDTLIAAAQRCDPLYDSSLEVVWRGVLGKGIAIMAAGVGSHDMQQPKAG